MPKFFVKHLCLIPPPYGGVTVYVKRLSLSLCKRGLPSGAFAKTNCVGIPESYKKYFDTNYPKHLHSFWSALEMPKLLHIFSKYKLIHNHYGISTAFTLYALHKILCIPAVWTIHNQMIDREFESTNWLDRYCFKQLANDSKIQIVAVNETEKKALQAKGYAFKNEIKVIPAYVPPVETGETSDYLDDALVKFIQNAKQLILFYAESFDVYNGQEIYGTQTIVDLFIRLKTIYPDLNLVFCLASLNGQDAKLSKLKECIKQNGLDDSVYWQIGAISEMWPLLKACTVYVRPTCTDGDSVMIREALAFGLPVVTSDVTKRPAGCTVYHFCDNDDLCNKTSAALANPKRKFFPQVDYSEVMLETYNKLLDSK